MRLTKTPNGDEYRCCDPWEQPVAIRLIDGQWYVIVDDARVGEPHATHRSAAASLARLLRNWRTAT